MFNDNQQKQRTYRYKRFMRDGSVKEITAVVRSRRKQKPAKESPA